MDYNNTFLQRFWSKVDKSGECWIWTASKTHNGYGQIGYNSVGDMIKAHRASFILNKGPIDNNLFVCHTCDNPACVNPDHLFLGTCQDNHTDRNNKGRTAKGRHNGKAKLSDNDVKLIREKYLSGIATRPQLAKEYNVKRHTIYSILNLRTWKHVK